MQTEKRRKEGWSATAGHKAEELSLVEAPAQGTSSGLASAL